MADINVKIGCFICLGCDIGQGLNLEALTKVAEKEGKCAVVKTHNALCAPEGIALIKNEIQALELNRISICACSARDKIAEFTFNSMLLIDRVSLREQVVWSHSPGEENTQMLAEDYIRMSIAKLKHSEIPEPLIQNTNKTVLVVGGGMSGMTSALSTAKAGYKVILVEKEAELGGWCKKFSRILPQKSPFDQLEPPPHLDLIKAIEAEPNITVHKSTTIKRISGEPGLFEVLLQNSREPLEIRVGSIVLATGWVPYDPHKLGNLGFGKFANVTTNIQMEEFLGSGALNRPSDGKPVNSVIFIQCAGSRDPEHLPYCSSVCCRTTLKQAKIIRKLNPECKVYIIYKDMRTPGQFELFYQSVQNDEGIFFTKGEVARVSEQTDKSITLEIANTLLGDNIEIEADLVVLATGMVPTTRVWETDIVEEPQVVTTSADGSKEKKAAVAAEPGAKILNLTYRQGTDLPTLKYGFPDSHYICFPYETRRAGIYAAGAVRAPMDLGQAAIDGNGAALKAIQAVEMISRGEALHPRSGDLSFPDFFLQRCTQCKRCTEECPFGTLDEDDKGTPQPHPYRCRRCGICMGSCPERIISFKNYSVHIISDMIKAIEVPPEEDEKPRVLALMCENDALPSLDLAAYKRLKWSPHIRIIPLRCLGSVNIVWIADALSAGFDGVILIGCKYGDDYQCHFIRGSELANTRMTNVQEKLKQLVLEEERVQIHQLSLDQWEKIPQLFQDFMTTIEKVGPNPYKGF